MRYLKKAFRHLIYKCDKFIFSTLLYFFILEVAVYYMMWRKQYSFISGFLRGFCEGRTLDDEEYFLVDEIYIELLESKKWFDAAFMGGLLNPSHPRLCYQEAILSKNLFDAWRIACHFRFKEEIEYMEQEFPDIVSHYKNKGIK